MALPFYDRLSAPLDPDSCPNIMPTVAKEVVELQELGIHVSLDDTNSPELLKPSEQLIADQNIEAWENIARTEGPEAAFESFTKEPGLRAWSKQLMRAVALHTLYGARKLITLGQGINPAVFSKPIFDGNKSALDLLADSKKDPAEGEQKALRIGASYRDFIETKIDDESRLIFMGCLDGRAVNSRAVTAFNIAVDHIHGEGSQERDDIRIASLACGAAGRVYSSFVKGLKDKGHTVERIELIDKDPMALATAYAIADDQPEIQERLGIHVANLLEPDFLECIEPKSLHVIDMLGLFEYLPRNKEEVAAFMKLDPDQLEEGVDYNFAAQLLRRAGTLVKPGGQIIFGNMLNERPQQTFFREVVQWPRLHQRTITEVLGIISDAGYDMDNVEVKIPANDGVYGVYAVTLPNTEDGAPAERNLQLVA